MAWSLFLLKPNTKISAASSKKAAEIGRIIKTVKSPSGSIKACFIDLSAIGVIIKAITRGAIGLSTFLKIAEKEKLPRVVSVQNPYSLINRTYEVGMSEISIRENAGLLAYSPLGIGYLTGKYRNK